MTQDVTRHGRLLAPVFLGSAGLLAAVLAAIWLDPAPTPATTSDAALMARFEIGQGDLERLLSEADLSREGLATLPPAIVEKTLRKLDARPRPDQPDDAMRWRMLLRTNEDGTIPDDALMVARRQRDVLVASPTDLSISDWEWLGPGNIGGRTRAMVIDPVNPNVMYAGGVSGGVWKTTNAGGSWTPLDDFMPSIAIGSIALDPNDHETLYVGTGEGVYSSSRRGAGIFRSTDAGATFQQLPSTATPDFFYVNRLAFEPGSSTTFLAATNTGIYRTSDAGATLSRRTTPARFHDVDFNPSDPGEAIAGSDFYAWWSDDGGFTWNIASGIPSGTRRVDVAYARSNPSIVYASVYGGSGTSALMRSTDAGRSYTTVNTTGYMGGQGWYDNIVWVDPTDPDIVIVGGIDLWRSSDGGNTLTKISAWQYAPTSAHADHHMIIEHPDYDGASNRRVYFANDGGVYEANDARSVSIFTGWQELNNNYGVTQFYSGAGNSSGVLIGGTQDNGTLAYDGDTETWYEIFGGDGTSAVADQEDTRWFYGSYQWGHLFRWNRETGSASLIYDGVTDVDNFTINFIPPFVLDPNDQQRLFIGGQSLWRTTNPRSAFPTWSAIKPAFGAYISAIAVAPNDSNRIYVGHNDGSLFRSVNGLSGSPTWERIDVPVSGASPPNRFASEIAVDPDDSDRLFATFGGYANGNVWRSEDGGQTWTNIGAGLPALPVTSLELDPSFTDRIWVGTDLGVFLTEDGGATWKTSDVGPANTVVDEVFLYDDENGNAWIVAATFGRGMYRTPYSALVACPADLTGDDEVDSIDLSALLGNWGQSGGLGDFDLGDPGVGVEDLSFLLGAWGPCATEP